MSSTTLKSRQWHEILAPHNLGYRIKLFSRMLTRQFQGQLEPFSQLIEAALANFS
jgi:MarR family transcriptional regulator, organic hydroperoxide resistance regulator